MRAPERCWRPLCLLGWAPCEIEWLGKAPREMWAVCAACGKRRVFLSTVADNDRMIDREIARRIEAAAAGETALAGSTSCESLTRRGAP